MTVFGQKLPREIEGHRIRSVIADCGGEFPGDKVKGLVPSHPLPTDFGVQEPSFGADGFTKGAAFGTEAAKIRGVVGVARDHRARGGWRHQQPAAGAAIGAGRFDHRARPRKMRPWATRAGQVVTCPTSAPRAAPLASLTPTQAVGRSPADHARCPRTAGRPCGGSGRPTQKPRHRRCETPRCSRSRFSRRGRALGWNVGQGADVEPGFSDRVHSAGLRERVLRGAQSSGRAASSAQGSVW